jgi:signal transduction histidine kinase
MKIHEGLSNLYEAKGDFKKAFAERKFFDVLKDSILTKDHLAAIGKMDVQYQTEKKDKEIAEQKLALEKSESKTRTMNILIVSLLLASILLWFLFQQRQKRIQQQLITIQREQEVRTLESLMEGEEKERLRIAKELHDGVNGDLSAIKFKLSSLLNMNNTVIKEAVTMIDKSCEQVRAISHNLVPPSLKDFNLLEAVDEYCQSMNSIHSPEITFQHLGNAIVLDKKQEANIYRIVQELVTNSVKHAEANEINVQLSHLDGTLQLTIEDDGKGFDKSKVESDGIGLQNVSSRIDYLNADLDFVSNEKGTSYTITMDANTI